MDGTGHSCWYINGQIKLNNNFCDEGRLLLQLFFFWSKKGLENSIDFIGILSLDVADLIRISLRKIGFKRISNFFFAADDDMAWLKMEFETNWPSLAFI